jgi:hypothetical protein
MVDLNNGTEERNWLRRNAKMVTFYAGAVGAILSVAVYWHQLDLPRFAYLSEVTSVESKLSELQQYSIGTRKITLNQDWFRLKTQLTDRQARLAADPRNWELIEDVTKIEQSLRDVEGQLEQIKRLERDKGRK